MRRQFPLRLAAAKTSHRAQGSTLVSVVVDMSVHKKCHGFAHSHYVAFSRVKSLAGLHIINLQKDKIRKGKKVDEEMARLSTESKMELCYVPLYTPDPSQITVAFHNPRYLHGHIEDVKCGNNFTEADLFSVCETWLRNTDSGDRFQIDGFRMYRQDGTWYECKTTSWVGFVC